MKIIAVCKKDFITNNLSFQFRKGIEYSGYNHGYYITLLDDKNEPFYFNDDNFCEHFDDKKELRKKKIEVINDRSL